MLLKTEPLKKSEKFVKPNEPRFFSDDVERLFSKVFRHFVWVDNLRIFMTICNQIAVAVGARLDSIAVSKNQLFIVADSDFK